MIYDLLAMLDRSGVNRNVADDVRAGSLDDVDRADIAAGAANRRDDFADHPHLVVNPNAHRDAVRRARRFSHFPASFSLARAILILHTDSFLRWKITGYASLGSAPVFIKRSLVEAKRAGSDAYSGAIVTSLTTKKPRANSNLPVSFRPRLSFQPNHN